LMGNSLLDVTVFGRIAGVSAAEYAKGVSGNGKLTLDHVRKFHQELEEAGVGLDRVSPMLLPDYTSSEVKKRQLNSPQIRKREFAQFSRHAAFSFRRAAVHP